MSDQIQDLALHDGRYSPEAFRFLFESLNHAVLVAGKEAAQGTERHVTGREVLEGMRVNALETFGPLAAQVWRSWGVGESMDWGRIVFLLVDHGMLNRQDSDSIEDFSEGFDFDEAFVHSYQPVIPGTLKSPGGDDGTKGEAQ
ncbi:MAG: putative repeat protein (TIGR04138 family) [Planctomycetota bacterium]|jgi:uncharacterized repeat protein (TIGR04138 family)